MSIGCCISISNIFLIFKASPVLSAKDENEDDAQIE